MKVARAKLREIGPDDVDMEEYKVRDQSRAGILPAVSAALPGAGEPWLPAACRWEGTQSVPGEGT